MNGLAYMDLLRATAPEAAVVATALAVLTADALWLRRLQHGRRSLACVLMAAAGCGLAAFWTFAIPSGLTVAGGIFVSDGATPILKTALLALAVASLFVSVESSFTEHVGEFCALLLLATVGLLFLVSSEDILMLFLALEFASLCLYTLTGFSKSDSRSAEAALKYFLFGGVSAAFTLFGLSLLYGISGSTNLGEIARAAQATSVGGRMDPLLTVAMVMVIVGFGFKVAIVPFHLWAPDVYDGAPAASAAFIASGSKVAGFYVFARVMLTGFAGADGGGAGQGPFAGWVPLLALLAAASMLLGNLVALTQKGVRRLLAYSAIAHAGYMLLGLMAREKAGVASLVYYAITYAVATLGAFAVVAAVEQRQGRAHLCDFAGLSREEPLLAGCLLIFVLSLAGIPPLPGFFAKFYVFARALAAGQATFDLLWLVTLAILMSAVSLYYYLVILKQVYVVNSSPGLTPPRSGSLHRTIVVLLAAVTLLLGCAPELLVGPLLRSL